MALAESCLRGGTGLPGPPARRPVHRLVQRVGRACGGGGASRCGGGLRRLCDTHGVPGQRIGTVGGDSLVADGCFAIPLTELAAGHGQTLPALFG